MLQNLDICFSLIFKVLILRGNSYVSVRPITLAASRKYRLPMSSTAFFRIHNILTPLFTSTAYIQCADPESFIRGGPKMITFFFYEGIEDPNTL